jgi:hypothetical protein
LWEFERGQYRITHDVRSPKPVGQYASLLKKFAHLDEEDLEDLQRVVNQRFQQIKALTGLTPPDEGPDR